jgi:membrane protein
MLKLSLVRRAVFAAYKDNCFGIAKGAAYSALLSFFPVLTSVTAILVQANAESVSRVLSQFLFEVVPPGAEELVEYQFKIRGAQPVSLLVVATLLSIWAASGLMASLMEGFQAAYRSPSKRHFLKQRGVAILLVLVAALPAVGASALVLFGDRSEKAVLEAAGLLDPSMQLSGLLAWVGRLIRYAVALSAVVLVTGALYYIGPSRPQKWRAVWPGAIMATFFWLLATLAFAWYVRNLGNYNVLYGSIGGVIALLVWMYLLAVIALVGCEYNAEQERMRK